MTVIRYTGAKSGPGAVRVPSYGVVDLFDTLDVPDDAVGSFLPTGNWEVVEPDVKPEPESDVQPVEPEPEPESDVQPVEPEPEPEPDTKPKRKRAKRNKELATDGR